MSISSVFGLLIALWFAHSSQVELSYSGVTLFLIMYALIGKSVEWGLLQMTNPTEI